MQVWLDNPARLLFLEFQMVTVRNLSFTYAGSTPMSFPDFQVGSGEHALLLGDSGSGKTTLLHLIGGLLRGYTGSVQVDGAELADLSEKELDHLRGRKIGFVFQRNHLISALTVKQNLLLASYLAEAPLAAQRVEEVLNHLSLTNYRNQSVLKISQGQAQRVAIARAVLNKPSVILADEPTSALDDKNCERVINLLLQAANENKTTLLVATHDHRLKSVISQHIMLRA
ncbi:MAG: ATP-binding cassette domain-containing protein [Flammeovirgaceae bacterium]|nr:MAG: ATP-binding cassette domain-containing protein [Flammeovirgaceae bacterium]